MATQVTPKEMAAKWDSDAKTVRKFLRADIVSQGGTVGVETPGKGKRYAIEAKSLRSLKVRFDAWMAAKAEKTAESPEALDALEGDEVLEVPEETETPDEG